MMIILCARYNVCVCVCVCVCVYMLYFTRNSVHNLLQEITQEHGVHHTSLTPY